MMKRVTVRWCFLPFWVAGAAALWPVPGQAQSKLRVQLRPDLVIGDESGVAFGDGLKLAVDSRGRIFVGDWMNRHVKVFSAEGRLQETIGRSGAGPGEFATVHQVAVARGDSLYVWDGNASRLTVYAPGTTHTVAYTVRPNTPAGVGRPYQFFVPANARQPFVFAFRQQASGTIQLRQVDGAGAVNAKPLLTGRSVESHMKVGKSGGATTVIRTSSLFGREPLVGITPDDQLYYGWSEAIELNFHDLTGRWTMVFRASTPRIPVTGRDVAHELQGSSKERREALKGVDHPETKPAVHTVLVDDESRIWTGRYTTTPSRFEWWVTEELGRGESAIFSLPDHVRIQAVRKGYAYAVSRDEVGAPTVVRFAIHTAQSAQK